MGILALQVPARSKSQYQGLKAPGKQRTTMHIKQSALANNLMFSHSKRQASILLFSIGGPTTGSELFTFFFSFIQLQLSNISKLTLVQFKLLAMFNLSPNEAKTVPIITCDLRKLLFLLVVFSIFPFSESIYAKYEHSLLWSLYRAQNKHTTTYRHNREK